MGENAQILRDVGNLTNDDLLRRMELQFEVEQFYTREASMLDHRRFGEWGKLFTDDVRYWMPIRRTRTSNELKKEFSALGDMAFIDDDKKMIDMRVKRIETGYAWAEDPPSRTRHLVTNVNIIEDRGDELTVETNFHLFRTRLNSEADNWFGYREDVLRRVAGALKIARRTVYLDETLLMSPNLSNFF
jgi:biphenyl 2,3-dioxygenase beta subunit